MTISRSPDRGTFQKESYLKSCENNGKDPDQKVLDMHQERIDNSIIQDEDTEWQKDNLEYDLRTCNWILEKVRASKSYAQNLYAAMCNCEFQKLAVVPILKEEHWSCSWRHAGGIIADMRQEGDYIDWYCSGIREDVSDADIAKLAPAEQKAYRTIYSKYVPEGHVTPEIKEDLQKLGWAVLPE